MREGTRYFITWKYRQVMIMAQKKDRSRFTIKFRESDPAHDMTIRILENQGQRNIAPFLVNAVLHYVQCSETPDVSHMLVENPQPVLDRQEIEDIVWGILRQQGIVKHEIQNETKITNEAGDFSEPKQHLDIVEDTTEGNIAVQNIINDEMRAMITKTLSVFRRE